MKRLLTIFLVFLVLLTWGCSRQTETGYTNFRSGSQGLSLRFLPYSPPSTIYDNDVVDFVIEIANKGAYDIRSGKLYITGFDRNIINIYENYFVFNAIEGKSEYNNQGEILIVDRYVGTRISLPGGVEEHNTPIEAIACYEYQTIASFPVCIDSDPRTSKHDGCSVSDVSPGTQGGPIAVSHVDVESGTGRMRLIITIRNVGSGDVIDFNACPFGYSYNEMDKIRSYDVDIQGIPLDCQPDSGSLKLDDLGQARIYCQANNLPEDAAYITPVTVTLNYDYKNSASTSVKIRGDI